MSLAIRHTNFVSFPKDTTKCAYLFWDTEAIKISFPFGLDLAKKLLDETEEQREAAMGGLG